MYRVSHLFPAPTPDAQHSEIFDPERGMILLETFIELKFLNVFFRAYPFIAIRQTAPYQAIRGTSSDSRQQYLSQQYPPPPLNDLSADSKCRSICRHLARSDLKGRHVASSRELPG